MPRTWWRSSRNSGTRQNKNFVLKLDDEIIKGCLVTHGGKIVNEKLIAKPS